MLVEHETRRASPSPSIASGRCHIGKTISSDTPRDIRGNGRVRDSPRTTAWHTTPFTASDKSTDLRSPGSSTVGIGRECGMTRHNFRTDSNKRAQCVSDYGSDSSHINRGSRRSATGSGRGSWINRPSKLIFWACVACIAYPYVVYPLVLAAVARRRGRPIRAASGVQPSVTIVLVARNEEAAIGRRVREFASLIAASGLRGEILVVSDGSTDGTAQAAGAAGEGMVPCPSSCRPTSARPPR